MVPRHALVPLAFLSLIIGVALVVTGGFSTALAGVRVSARSPVPSLALAALVAIVWATLAARDRGLRADLEAATDLLGRGAWLIVLAAAVVAAIAAAAFHSFSASGADASGYLSHTAMLLDGALRRPEPIASVATWPRAAETLAPLGWRAALEPGFQVPTYAVGLPALMAPFHAVAGDVGASLLIPLSLAVAVIVTGLLADRLAGRFAAIVAAVWLATSPIALFESMQVMSDVPATAAWLLAWWCVFRGRPACGGVAVAIAILIRPNLAAAAIVPALCIAVRALDATASGRLRTALGPVLRFVVPVGVAGLLVASLQWRYFGSPLRSGYGTAAEIYDLSNLWPNVRFYFQWLLDTHGPWLLVAPLALVVRSGRPDGRQTLAWLMAFAVVLVSSYLVYAIFETWTYLRFLLPAIAIAMVGSASVFASLLARLPAAARGVVTAAAVLGLAAANVTTARERSVFRVGDQQARARSAGEHLAAFVPANAVIVSGEQSGAMRYYTGRSIVRWDLMDRRSMAEAVGWLTLNGYEIWIVLDDWEEPAFRRTFPELAAASIDRPPVFTSAPGTGMRTLAWKVPAGFRLAPP